MRLELAESVHAVMIDDDLVFLDVDADAYFCLPLPHGHLRHQGGGLETDDPHLGEELVRAGLARRGPQSQVERGQTPTPPQRTARRLLELTPSLKGRLRLAHLGALAWAVGAGLASRRKSFRQLIKAARTVDLVAAPGHDLSRLLADVAAWRRLSPWLPMDGVCLFRSNMLLAFLTALGHRPAWVFGVRTWPFQAHCWLQMGDIALDDEAERLCAYAPIMAV